MTRPINAPAIRAALFPKVFDLFSEGIVCEFIDVGLVMAEVAWPVSGRRFFVF
jgi:hypothetical protein